VPVDSGDVLRDWQQRAEQQAEFSLELSRRMQETTATVESAGGEVVVTVDHSGGMTDLRLAGSAMRMSAGELAALILGTGRRAQAAMAGRMAELVKGMYGADSATTAFIAGTYAEQFPVQPDDDEKRGRR
jgi:broad specificity phosphatase PhoE